MTDSTLDTMVIKLVGDGSSFMSMMERSQTATQQVMGQIEKQTGQLMGWGNRLGSWATSLATSIQGQVLGLASLGSAIMAIRKGFDLASTAEQAQIQFETMLHSGEKATQLMSEIEQFAAATPLQTAGITQAAKTLLQFNVAGENVMPMLKMLGNATGGDNERFQRMALAFGQMSAAGRLMGQDLMQMVNAGFNPLQQISKTTGKSMAQLHEEMERGQISVQMVADAFTAASAKGGQFEGLMEKQSMSLGGLWSTLTDNVQIQLKRLTQFVVDQIDLKPMVKHVSDFINDSQPMIEKWAWYFIQSAKSIYYTVAPTIWAIADTVRGVVSAAMGYWNSLSANFRTVLSVFAGIVVAVGPVLAAVSALATFLPGIGAFAVIAAAGIFAYFTDLQSFAQGVYDTVSALWGYMSPIVLGFVNVSIAAWNMMGEIFGQVLNSIGEVFFSTFGQLGGPLINVAKVIQETIVEALTVAEFAFLNWQQVGSFVAASMWDSLVRYAAQTQYIFTTVLPGYIVYYAQYTLDEMKILMSNWATILDNLSDNVVTNMHNVFSYLWGESSELKFVWKPLAEGLKTALHEAIKIPEREIGLLEQTTGAAVEALGNSMAANYTEFRRKKNLKPVDDTFSMANETFKETVNKSEALGLKMGDSMAAAMHHGTEAMKSGLLGTASAFDTWFNYMKGKNAFDVPGMPGMKKPKTPDKEKKPAIGLPGQFDKNGNQIKNMQMWDGNKWVPAEKPVGPNRPLNQGDMDPNIFGPGHIPMHRLPAPEGAFNGRFDQASIETEKNANEAIVKLYELELRRPTVVLMEANV